MVQLKTIPTAPQLQLLLDHLIHVGHITPMQARELYRVNSFHRRMADLKQQVGVQFVKRWKHDNTGRRYVSYQFAGFEQRAQA